MCSDQWGGRKRQRAERFEPLPPDAQRLTMSARNSAGAFGVWRSRGVLRSRVLHCGGSSADEPPPHSTARPGPPTTSDRGRPAVRAITPLHPPRVQGGVGVIDAGVLEEHDQVVVVVGGSKIVPAAAMRGDPPTARDGGPVHDDRRVSPSVSWAAHGTGASVLRVPSLTPPVPSVIRLRPCPMW